MIIKLCACGRRYLQNYKEDPKVLKKQSQLAEEAYEILHQLRQFVFYCRTLIDGGEFDKATKVCNKALEEAKSKQAQEAVQIEGLINYIKTRKENNG